jgi:hypothetical protein
LRRVSVSVLTCTVSFLKAALFDQSQVLHRQFSGRLGIDAVSGAAAAADPAFGFDQGQTEG